MLQTKFCNINFRKSLIKQLEDMNRDKMRAKLETRQSHSGSRTESFRHLL